jgi:3-isopropylmalate dehydrogenase
VTAYSIACLAGDGIGPEVMAQASRGLRAAARLHGLELEEEHVPFGADATMRVGQPFPLASRNAALAADAILAATIDPTLLHSLEGELDLRAAVMRARLRGAAITFVAPLRPMRGTGRWSARSPRHARAEVTSRSSGARTAGRPRRRGLRNATTAST